MNNISVRVECQTAIDSLEMLEKEVQKLGLSMVAGIGADARKAVYPRFFNKRYTMEAHGSLNLLDIKYTKRLEWDAGQGRLDRRGWRLVGFSLENKRPDKKVAYFASYPMNLYEEDAHFKSGYTRPGTHLFRGGAIARVIEGMVPKNVAKFQRKLAEYQERNSK